MTGPRTPAPSPDLPQWARSAMDEWRSRSRRTPVPIDEELPHRRDAFYRLYTAGGPEVRAMWAQAGAGITPDHWFTNDAEVPRRWFLRRVILASDAIYPDTPLPVYGMPTYTPPRLRTREQRHARKLAALLQLLRVVTPPRCAAYNSRIMWASADVEWLIIMFAIGQVPRNYDLRWQMSEFGIEFTTDSKRGWRQHRRASDQVRKQAIRAARELAALPGASDHAAWLDALVADLAALPTINDEHRDDVELLSQKASWLDWFRVAYLDTHDLAAPSLASPLRWVDWATLARVVADAPDATDADVAKAVPGLAGFSKNLRG